MTVKPITTGDLFQGGRIEAFDPSTGPSFLRYVEAIFALADPLEFNFPNAQATGQTFGIVRSVFINNSDNDYDVTVLVAGTRQQFVAYAGSQGFYKIDSQMGSTILASTAGDSTGPVEFIFYNTPQTPFVWYEKNPNTISAAVTIADGADVALGSTTDAAVTNPATDATVIAYLRGLLTQGVTALANLASLITNTGPYSNAHITTLAVTAVKAAPGTLGRVNINTAGAGCAATVADGATILAVIDCATVRSVEFNVACATNITVTTAGGVAPDLSVTFR